jgi:hypothetical protein
MSVKALLQAAQFVVDAEGRKKAVMLDVTVWEELVELLTDTSEPHETRAATEPNGQSDLDTAEGDAIQAETEAFWAMYPELAQTYQGRYVALRRGQVVDHDADVSRLEQRVRAQFGATPVLIAPVTPSLPRELHWRGGHLELAPV